MTTFITSPTPIHFSLAFFFRRKPLGGTKANGSGSGSRAAKPKSSRELRELEIGPVLTGRTRLKPSPGQYWVKGTLRKQFAKRLSATDIDKGIYVFVQEAEYMIPACKTSK